MRFLSKRREREIAELLENQQVAIQILQSMIVIYAQQMRDLVVAFRIAQDNPGVDIGADLDNLVRDLCDIVAQLEEHVA
jgi:hypothetical protein